MPEPLIPPSPSAADYAAAQGPPPDDLAFFAAPDPFALFADWLGEAKAKEPNDPHAMALATCGADGQPDVRMVLLKDFNAAGFVFFTNAESAKGRALAENARAGLCFHWKSLRRQVRVRGPVTLVEAGEADAYFATRARGARIGAWASYQSRPLTDRAALEARIAAEEARFAGAEPTRPPFWLGYRVAPLEIEFWRDRPFRLHDRLRFHREAPGGAFARDRLYP